MYEIVILTGSGISTESVNAAAPVEGVDILWRYNMFDIAQLEVFERDPALVHKYYNVRRKLYRNAMPNNAHCALRWLEALLPVGKTLVVTTNVDDLHERAGSKNVWHMHGEITRARCTKKECGHRWDAPEEMVPEDLCPSCGTAATRPDIVWFGEIPRFMDKIHTQLRQAKMFVQIGSAGTVYPAANFAQMAKEAGARTLSLNLAEPDNAAGFDELRSGMASTIVPEWVEEMLRQKCVCQ